MTGRIPENILEDILSRIDIVEVISGYIPLKRAGRNFKASCPFHHEKTPSFMVSQDKQIYHCFGCGVGGNAFNFLIQYERLEFPETVEILARKAGVVLPEAKKEDPQSASLALQLYKINALAALFYENILSSPESKEARDYLEKRGINTASVKLLKLGFAPNNWDSLINFLRAKGISLSLLEKAGLILAKENGGYYDRFRNRIIFPVLDVKSRVIGFGARVLDDTLPKYINSPETAIYTKGRNLFGLHLSKDALRDSDYAVVVEGYLDFILPYQEGLHNIIASSGTALTPEQVRLIKRYTHNAVIIYDGDDAGEAATLRALDIFIEEDMNVKVVSLPKGLDPDSFVRKNGVKDLKEKIDEARDIFEYKLKVLRAQFNFTQIAEKTKIASIMLATINKFKNAVLKSEYIKRLAEELDVKEDALTQELNKIKDLRANSESDKITVNSAPNMNPTEKLLLSLMLKESGLISRLRNTIAPADFQDERASRLVSMVYDLVDQGKAVDFRYLISRFDDACLRNVICETALSQEVPPDNKEHMIEDCIRRLKAGKAKLKMRQLHEEIKAMQKLGDKENLRKLMQEFNCLMKDGR